MMDIETCLKKHGYVGVLDFATVDEDGLRRCGTSVPFDHCLQCGNCFENCPVQAVQRY